MFIEYRFLQYADVRRFMRHTDIAIVGGGIAGSMAAAMLGRAGWDVVLIDPHSLGNYPLVMRLKHKVSEIRISSRCLNS